MISILEAQNHMLNKNIKPGMKVSIIKKEHQGSGEETMGFVKDILTKKAKHTRGIKVRLESGEVGRVSKIY